MQCDPSTMGESLRSVWLMHCFFSDETAGAANMNYLQHCMEQQHSTGFQMHKCRYCCTNDNDGWIGNVYIYLSLKLRTIRLLQ